MQTGSQDADPFKTIPDTLDPIDRKPPIIRITSLRKTFRSGDERIEAIRGITMSVKAGTCTFLVGPSGSGKSTLLYLLGALDEPTSGTIEIDGQKLTSINESKRDLFRREKVGFIFQQFNLIPHLTAVGNVLMPFVPTGLTAKLREQARATLSSVGLGHRLNHRPSALSGGQQQRVAIARALIKDPLILLADEPTGNLDHKSGDEIFALLREQQRLRGCTLVVVTHDRRFIQPTDQVIEIEDGLLVG
jgi:putative ABC transport system ATP-binding protein